MGKSVPNPERERGREGWARRIASGVVEVVLLGVVIWAVATGGPFASDAPPSPRPAGPDPSPDLFPLAPPLPPGSTVAGSPNASDGDRTDRVGFPPEGARPSRPEHGELITSDWGIHPFYAVYVYADGRLIWERSELGVGWPAGKDFPEGPSGYTTGLVERRLTPEGVELLRSRTVPLEGQHSLPASQLPAPAWEDAEFGSYVPATFAVCFWPDGNATRADAIDQLPARAQDLLRGRERTFEAGPADEPFTLSCFEVTTDQARALGRIFGRDARFRQDRLGVRDEPWYRFSHGDGAARTNIAFEPILPHGEIVLEGG